MYLTVTTINQITELFHLYCNHVANFYVKHSALDHLARPIMSDWRFWILLRVCTRKEKGQLLLPF